MDNGDTIIPPPRPVGERLARLESRASDCRKQHDRVREDVRAFFERHDERDRTEAAQTVVVEALAKDVSSLKTTQRKHAMIVYAGSALFGAGVLVLKFPALLRFLGGE